MHSDKKSLPNVLSKAFLWKTGVMRVCLNSKVVFFFFHYYTEKYEYFSSGLFSFSPVFVCFKNDG